jgi:sugar transferase (PEP-CTERM/EpsH1 system associated)
MEPLLYLTHRIPFPPNKGDKLRSFNLLKYLAARYRVHLGTFVDNPDDRAQVSRVAEYCASIKVAEIQPAIARLRSLSGLVSGEPLTLGYYRDSALAAWVRTVIREQGIGKVVVFSSAMAQYVTGIPGLRVVVDFVDVDSAKWGQYALSRRWPLSAIFERERDHLLAFERAVARGTDASVFVTPAEAELFRKLAPECASRVCCAQNGVDTTFFAPQPELANPFRADEEPIVFTGAMDYWPNIDAVCWFAQEALPAIVASHPRARFYIVGMQPTPVVQALARDPSIVVTGTVPDVRPYLEHARVIVAPLRVARGIQNKVLEAMAMGRPVVASVGAATGLAGAPGVEYEVAETAAEFSAKTVALMDQLRGGMLGAAARARITTSYDWAANLAPFEALLQRSADSRAAAG